MVIEESIKAKNYKCFASEPQGFERIYPINIIIGKNNSGKSSLLDMIEYVISYNENFTKFLRVNIVPEVVLSHTLLEKDVTEAVTKLANLTVENSKEFRRVANSLLSQKINYRLYYNAGSNQKIINILDNIYWEGRDALEKTIKPLFDQKKFKRINAERDIIPEDKGQKRYLESNGGNATNIIRQTLNTAGFDPNIIKKELLYNINVITEPDITFKDIIVREDSIAIETGQNGKWEIHLEDAHGSWVALSKMGSGIKTIILVLLNLLVLPKLHTLKFEDCIFGFEELENNLHPSLQRRLFNYISRYSKEHGAYFFITTHSSIAIDLFGNNPNAQLIHVQKKGDYSIATSIFSKDHKSILKDLDYKPSDLLLSNGIIWVEGPSDVIYLELLLDLYKQKIASEDLEKFSYMIQSLSTAVWKYAGFVDFNWAEIENDETLQNKIISLQKLNHNHLLVIDNDSNYEDKKPSEWESFSNGIGKNKAKLIYESLKDAGHEEGNLQTNYGDTKDGILFFWINDGTFETYLEGFINNKGTVFAKYFDKNPSNGYFEKKRAGENCSISKVVLASDIAKFFIKEELKLDDIAPADSPLLNKIERLYQTIKSWN